KTLIPFIMITKVPVKYIRCIGTYSAYAACKPFTGQSCSKFIISSQKVFAKEANHTQVFLEIRYIESAIIFRFVTRRRQIFVAKPDISPFHIQLVEQSSYISFYTDYIGYRPKNIAFTCGEAVDKRLAIK